MTYNTATYCIALLLHLYYAEVIAMLKGHKILSTPQSKNAVSTYIKHSRYFH